MDTSIISLKARKMYRDFSTHCVGACVLPAIFSITIMLVAHCKYSHIEIGTISLHILYIIRWDLVIML